MTSVRPAGFVALRMPHPQLQVSGRDPRAFVLMVGPTSCGRSDEPSLNTGS